MARKKSTTTSVTEKLTENPTSDKPSPVSKTTGPDSVTIRYDLFDLPTSQHKAGLAGLVLSIRSLSERSKKDESKFPADKIPEIVSEPDATSVTVKFTAKSVQGLMDDIYAATIEEVSVKAKWQGVTPKRTEEVEEPDPKNKDKKLKVKRFFYDQVQARGNVLRSAFRPNAEKIWLKLWHDMLWAIPRGNPQSRAPFEDRAADLPCREGPDAWSELQSAATALDKGTFVTAEVAGSLWLGAQANNAESVPFKGRVEQNFLLHFWPLTVLITVPQRFLHDGKQETVGYVLAIPEVSQLARFCEKFPQFFSQFTEEPRGYRPAQAIIELPAQGALEFISNIAKLKFVEQEETPMRAVNSVEFLHMDRQGNNVKLLASGRVPANETLLQKYRAIVDPTDTRFEYCNPLFKGALIRALLRNKPWWGELLSLFMERDHRFFVQSDNLLQDAPEIARLPWFWMDVERCFQQAIEILANQRKEKSQTMTSEQPPGNLERMPEIIRRLVRTYVFASAYKRSGLDPDKFKKDDNKTDFKKLPKEWHDEKKTVAERLFLEFRSRRDQDFVDHFAATFFAVSQWFKLDPDDFQLLSEYLLDRDYNRRDDLKTLTMAALSAVSWTASDKESQGEKE